MLNKILDKIVLALFDKVPFFQNNKRTIGNVLTVASAILYALQSTYPIAQLPDVLNWLNVLMAGLSVKAIGDQHAAAKARIDAPVVA